MEEEKLLKKQFVLHILYNMVAFALILSAFGIFMSFMIKNITFSSVDKQLQDAKSEIIGMNDKFKVLNKLFESEENQLFDEELEKFDDFSMSRRISNPQIISIERDSNGEILNKNELGRIIDYVEDVEFDSSVLDSIYDLNIDNKFNYRCLNIQIDEENGTYLQLLVSIDSEIGLINNYFKIIVYAVIFGITISGIASYILSRKTLKPIEETLIKQTEFVQNASHELRTPLTIIQAKQELLLQEPNAKIIDKSEDISLTLSETKRLSKLTKDLMILVRGDKFKLQKEDVAIDEFINSIIMPYSDIANSQGKEVTSNLNFGKEISIDTNKIHQLLVILLDNAIKYTEHGDRITVNTYLKDNKCVIEVADTGIGISDEGLKRIFDRFYREDKARNRETGGTGLGLSIASMIVSAHNGTIKASHNNPKGTVFTIRLNR